MHRSIFHFALALAFAATFGLGLAACDKSGETKKAEDTKTKTETKTETKSDGKTDTKTDTKTEEKKEGGW
jgi:hypothetical protein